MESVGWKILHRWHQLLSEIHYGRMIYTRSRQFMFSVACFGRHQGILPIEIYLEIKLDVRYSKRVGITFSIIWSRCINARTATQLRKYGK